MTEAALPSSGVSAPRAAKTGAAASIDKPGDASRRRTFRETLPQWPTSSSRPNQEPPTGLLSVSDDTLRKAAQRLSRSAPDQFGRLNEIYLRGHLVLKDADRGILNELVAESVRAAAPTAANGKALDAIDLAALDDRVNYASEFLARREGEIARRRYAGGLLVGVAVSLGVLAVIYVASVAVMTLWLRGANVSQIPPEQIDAIRDVLVAVGGGAAGACVSVLLRLDRVQNLTIEAAFGGAAQYRIYLGWFFAGALVFLLKSGILAGLIVIPDPSVGPTERVESWFFWGAVGFLAGFNERWATNLIARGPGDSLAAGSTTSAAKPKTTDLPH